MTVNFAYPVIFHPFTSRVYLQPFKCDTTPPKHIILSESVDKLVIGTYNVLFPQKFDKDQFSSNAGYSVTADMVVIPNHTWRVQIKIKNILNASPNSFALQEVTQEEFNEYQNMLQGYAGLFCLHPRGIHGVAIFYKLNEFDLIGAKKGTFEYDIPTRYSTITKSRIHLIADLQDKSGMTLRVVSCHLFDPRDFIGKVKSRHLEAVVDHSNISSSDSIDMLVICGDMNQDQFGDDVNACLNEDPQPVEFAKISAFAPVLKDFIHDNNLAPTQYDKDLSHVDGAMLSTKRKTDWIFIKTKNNIKVEQLKGVVLKSVKISSDYPNLQKKEHDLRGSDHALTLTKIQIKRTFF